MADFKLSKKRISQINATGNGNFPKYTTQLMNIANQNAGGTKPAVVGQLSELFPEYLAQETQQASCKRWEAWYRKRYPETIETAVGRVRQQIENLKQALPLITDEMLLNWVTDLVISKTFDGLYVQKAVISEIAKREKKSYRLADPAEEAVGIDGYIGDEPVSVKPDTYLHMIMLNEQIHAKITTYTKKKDGITVHY